MKAFLDSIDPGLIWLIVGIVFLFLEFTVPGAILVFFSVGAFVTAVLVWLGVLPSLTGQLICFGAATLVTLLTLRRFWSRHFQGTTRDASAYDETAEFVGQTARVIRKIVPGSGEGRVLFEGAEWKAVASTPIAVGTHVRIVGQKNITFEVAPTEEKE